jgi:hypothetical protein
LLANEVDHAAACHFPLLAPETEAAAPKRAAAMVQDRA